MTCGEANLTVKYLRPMLWGIREELLELAAEAEAADPESASLMRDVATGPLEKIGVDWEARVND